jgi:hypothetical protein
VGLALGGGFGDFGRCSRRSRSTRRAADG